MLKNVPPHGGGRGAPGLEELRGKVLAGRGGDQRGDAGQGQARLLVLHAPQRAHQRLHRPGLAHELRAENMQSLECNRHFLEFRAWLSDCASLWPPAVQGSILSSRGWVN